MKIKADKNPTINWKLKKLSPARACTFCARDKLQSKYRRRRQLTVDCSLLSDNGHSLVPRRFGSLTTDYTRLELIDCLQQESDGFSVALKLVRLNKECRVFGESCTEAYLCVLRHTRDKSH